MYFSKSFKHFRQQVLYFGWIMISGHGPNYVGSILNKGITFKYYCYSVHNAAEQCFVKQIPNNSEMLINILGSQTSQVHLSVSELVLAHISIRAPDSAKAMSKAPSKPISKATSTQATGTAQLKEPHHVN